MIPVRACQPTPPSIVNTKNFQESLRRESDWQFWVQLFACGVEKKNLLAFKLRVWFKGNILSVPFCSHGSTTIAVANTRLYRSSVQHPAQSEPFDWEQRRKPKEGNEYLRLVFSFVY